MARDIRTAVDALPVPWWRRPIAWAGGLAAAAAVAGALAVLAPGGQAVRPPAIAVAPAVTTEDEIIDRELDEELALGNPVAAEEELEELDLDDAAAARIEAAL